MLISGLMRSWRAACRPVLRDPASHSPPLRQSIRYGNALPAQVLSILTVHTDVDQQ